jgi:hypothetical protein
MPSLACVTSPGKGVHFGEALSPIPQTGCFAAAGVLDYQASERAAGGGGSPDSKTRGRTPPVGRGGPGSWNTSNCMTR